MTNSTERRVTANINLTLDGHYNGPGGTALGLRTTMWLTAAGHPPAGSATFLKVTCDVDPASAYSAGQTTRNRSKTTSTWSWCSTPIRGSAR